MTEYEESDDEYLEVESDEVPLSEALRETCYGCGSALTWVLNPDPDSLWYTAECDDCEYSHRIRPTKAVVTVEDSTL